MKPLTLTLNPRSLFLATLGLALAAGGWLAGQGALTPPGAPAPTMRTLAQIEPRTPISVLPFTISEPGSYYLTTNLTGVPGPGTHGITISASGVTLDLMGFELVGGGTVGAKGISVNGSRTNLVVRNGTVRGWSLAGMDGSEALTSQVEGLAAFSNGAGGIKVDTGSRVTGCTARANVGYGILAGSGCTVSGCTASGNNGVGAGITAGFGSTVSGCTASGNTGGGIVVDFNSTVYGCTISGNPGTGLAAGEGSTVNDCTSSSNGGTGIVVGDGGSVTGCAANRNTNGIIANSGCTIEASQASNNTGDGIRIPSGFGATTIRGCAVRTNAGDGIEVFNSCLVVDNLCDGNGAGAGDGAGIHVIGLANRIDGNHVTSNDRGMDVDNTPNFIVRNTASANATNYDISAGNRVGVTVIPPPGTAFTGHTGGEGVASTDPWANFTY